MPQAREAKRLIMECARDLGIDGLAFADASPLGEALKMIQAAGERGFIPAEYCQTAATLRRFTTPRSHLASARSVISAYESYYTRERECPPLGGSIAPYTACNYYEDLRQRLLSLAEFMNREFHARAKAFSCYVRLAEKPLARRSGLGFYGKHGIIVTPGHGSFVVLGEIVTNLELEPDGEVEISCGDCALCVSACPTKALGSPYFVDTRLCIQAYSGSRGTVPLWMRDLWQNRLYGCTSCQDACPRNRHLMPNNHAVKIGAVGTWLPLKEMLLISDEEFAARFRHNQIGSRERNAIRRDAIIAAGNSMSDVFAGDLVECASDPDPMIRQHCLWALARILGPRARQVLDRALVSEPEPCVKQEIKTLLDGLSAFE